MLSSLTIVSKREILTVALLFLSTFAFRYWYIVEYENYTPIRGDAYHYIQYTQNLLEHGVFSKSTSATPAPDSYWAPGYPFFLAICSLFADFTGADHYLTILVSQAILGALLVVLTWLFARRFLPYTWSFLPAVLVFLSPHLVTHGSYVLTETLFAFIHFLALLVFVLAVTKRGVYLMYASAVCFGIAYLVNPVILFAFPLLVLLSIRYQMLTKSFIRHSLISILVFSTFVFCWQIRNALVVPENAPRSSERVFVNLVIGMHEDYHKIWRTNPRDPNNPATLDQSAFQGSYKKLFTALASRVAERPGHYLQWYLIGKPLQLWDWDILTGQGDIYVYPAASTLYNTSALAMLSVSIMKALHPLLLGAALFAWVFLLRDAKPTERFHLQVLYSVLIYVSAIYVVLQSEARYSVPLRPEMYLCASFFIMRLTTALKRELNASRERHNKKTVDSR